MERGCVSKVLYVDTSYSYEVGQIIGLDPICSLSPEGMVRQLRFQSLRAANQKSRAHE